MTIDSKTKLPNGIVVIEEELCKGCGLCVESCPHKLLKISRKKINAKGYHPVDFHDEEGTCKACKLCAIMCPDLAIKVYKKMK